MIIENVLKEVEKKLSHTEKIHGEALYNEGECQILSQSAVSIDFLVNTGADTESAEYCLVFTNKNQTEASGFTPLLKNKTKEWDRFSYACLLQYEYELKILDPKEKLEHKKYTRQGMINRVLSERRQKAEKATYKIKWADNIFGDHILTNESAVQYKIFLRDFEKETGYSDSWDSKLNKLGTTKHIMYAFKELKNNKELFNNLDKTYPFIEVYCDPLNEYRITWHYPHDLPTKERVLIKRFFGNNKYLDESSFAVKSFLNFITCAEEEFENICIRPEVREKVEREYESSMLAELQYNYKIDYSPIKADLFPYQKEGIEFALFKKVAIIADEMGLGKTIQAIAIAVLKKQLFDFKKILVVCPATLKSQWKKEIEKFTNEKALIISGLPKEREEQYNDNSYSFYIVNYETILRDSGVINNADMDFLILDEAQRVKNYETKTSSSIKKLITRQTLIITGTPIENRLIDIFSVVSVLDPYFFGPLWEFSYQYCLFDTEKTNKINGYYNLQELNKKLSEILIRREKRNVLDQLPNVQQFDIPIALSREQAEYHAGYAAGIARIIRKKFLTAFDMQRLQMFLSKMRMVCNSTYLVDEKTNISPKLEELKHILFEQLDIKNNDRKIIIFSEWVKMHKLIGQVLREHKVGFVEFSGKVPVKSRGELIKKFEKNPECKVFLSTEAGGSGLNLQFADMLINFELPWNPAKKNQRIGRIDRLGQKSGNLTIFNLITQGSIESQIAIGLLIKQNLFEGVLDAESSTDYVDFSTKGRSQFIEQLEAFISQSEDASTLNIVSPAFEQDDIAAVVDEFNEDLDIISERVEDDIQEQLTIEEITKDHIKSVDDYTEEERIRKVKETTVVELEQVMTSGMQFLAGLFKMSTGKDMGLENQQISIDKESGEVTMKFKLPL